MTIQTGAITSSTRTFSFFAFRHFLTQCVHSALAVESRIVKITPSSHFCWLHYVSVPKTTATTWTSCDQLAHILCVLTPHCLADCLFQSNTQWRGAMEMLLLITQIPRFCWKYGSINSALKILRGVFLSFGLLESWHLCAVGEQPTASPRQVGTGELWV